MVRLGAEGVPPGAAAVPAAAHRHDVEVPRDDRVPRSRSRKENGLEPHRPHEPGRARARTSTRSITAAKKYTTIMKTQALLQALAKGGFDAAFGGARRDEERSRAKERIYSFRDRVRAVGSEEPAPRALEPLQRARSTRARASASSRSRTGPSSTSGSTSGSRTSRSCRSTSPRERPVVERDGTLVMVDDERMRAAARREAARRAWSASARSAATRSSGAHPSRARRRCPEIIREMLLTRVLRASGSPDRPRRGRLDGERRSARGTSDGSVERSDRRPSVIETDILGYLEQHEHKELLRFVDRRLGRRRQVDAHRAPALRHARRSTKTSSRRSKRASQHGGRRTIDFSLFTDGLEAEREQGITIDVAYRYFTTEKRKFIIADTPGHVQYTRNMVTGASTADVAIILIDARLGVLAADRAATRTSRRCSAFRTSSSCVNKMDLRRLRPAASSTRIRREFARVRGAARLQGRHVHPDQRAQGRQRRARAATRCPGTTGRRVLEFLETVPIAQRPEPRRLPLPGAVRAPAEPRLPRVRRRRSRRASCKKGDAVMVLPSRQDERACAAIDTFDGERRRGVRADERHAAPRGRDRRQPRRHAGAPGQSPARRAALRRDVVWMHERRSIRSKSYFLKHTTQHGARRRSTRVHVRRWTSRRSSDVPAETLELNDIGRVTLTCHRPLFFDAYAKNRAHRRVHPRSTRSPTTRSRAGMILDDDGAAPQELDAALRRAARRRSGAAAHAGERARARASASGTPAAWRCCSRRARRGLREVAYALERRLFDLGHVGPRARSPATHAAGGGLGRARLHRRRPGHAVRQRRRSRRRRRQVRARVGEARVRDATVPDASDGPLDSTVERLVRLLAG